jgi:hypothetical protein
VHNPLVPCPRRDVSRSSRYAGRRMRWTLRRQVWRRDPGKVETGFPTRITPKQNTPDENARSGRRSRVVLAPRPWRQAGARYRADDGGKKRRSPGRSRISRKTIARGKPGCPGCTCSSTRVLFCSTLRTRDCGRSRRPAFPAPSERADEMQNLGQIGLRERERVFLLLVIPGRRQRVARTRAR